MENQRSKVSMKTTIKELKTFIILWSTQSSSQENHLLGVATRPAPCEDVGVPPAFLFSQPAETNKISNANKSAANFFIISALHKVN